MIEIKDKRRCSGCAACYNVCPVHAITMQADREGFLYPCIDQSVCIQCGRCDRICPYISMPESRKDLQACFAAYNADEKERSISSSGGIFIALARAVIRNGGVVYGAAYDEDHLVYHAKAEDDRGVKRLVGSKYLQSRIGEIYQDVSAQLKKQRQVLFVGSSCQIGGLRSFLGMDPKGLICVDFICLGVPSPKIWRDYLDVFFDRNKIKAINFKDKSNGWHSFSFRLEGEDGTFKEIGTKNPFFIGYFKQLYSRPSCSECIFKQGDRVSDITISDCWGYDHIAPELDDDKGLSSIVCHTEKGYRLFQAVQERLVWKEADMQDILRYNSNYQSSAPMGRDRKRFWNDYDRLSKEELFERYCRPEKVPVYKILLRKLKDRSKRIRGL